MKQYLLKSKVGHLALDLRDKVEIVSAALFKPESVGTIANDQLATYLVNRLCRKEMVFVDIGAHIGSILSEVQRNCSSIKIHAVEAIPAKAEKIKQYFTDIDIHNCAVGDSAGEVVFYEDTQKSGYSSLIKPLDTKFIREIKVPLRKLDDLIPHKGVDIIKIDVEGAELRVLQGSQNIVNESRPVILFESAPGEENTKEKIWNFFQIRNYILLAPNRLAHNDTGLSLDAFLDGHLYPRRTTNYFAVHKERRKEVQELARKILGIAV